jgi:CBS domain-containing protein
MKQGGLNHHSGESRLRSHGGASAGWTEMGMGTMKTVLRLLQKKGSEVWTIGPEASVFSALERMAEKNVGALVVTEGERPVGIFSERDYARKVVLRGRSSRETPVKEIMTRDPITVSPGESVDRCMELMTEKRVRHLPVLDENRLAGIVSIGDIVKEVITEQSATISYLEDYITGRH